MSATVLAGSLYAVAVMFLWIHPPLWAAFWIAGMAAARFSGEVL